MTIKTLEVRDRGTFIPVLCVDMNPSPGESEARRYLLRRCGYPCDGRPNVLLTRLDGDGQATNDPYGWTGSARTIPQAHNYIIEHWNEIADGDVVDVEFILGNTTTVKESERLDMRYA